MKNPSDMTLEERRDFCRKGIERVTPAHNPAQQAMLRMYLSLLDLPRPSGEPGPLILEDMLARR